MLRALLKVLLELRMREKMESLLQELEEFHQKISTIYCDGLVDGLDQKQLGCQAADGPKSVVSRSQVRERVGQPLHWGAKEALALQTDTSTPSKLLVLPRL